MSSAVNIDEWNEIYCFAVERLSAALGIYEVNSEAHKKNHRNPIEASCFVKEPEKHEKYLSGRFLSLLAWFYNSICTKCCTEHKKLMRISLLAASGDWVQVVNIFSFFLCQRPIQTIVEFVITSWSSKSCRVFRNDWPRAFQISSVVALHSLLWLFRYSSMDVLRYFLLTLAGEAASTFNKCHTNITSNKLLIIGYISSTHIADGHSAAVRASLKCNRMERKVHFKSRKRSSLCLMFLWRMLNAPISTECIVLLETSESKMYCFTIMI